MTSIELNEITIRTELQPGDIGYVIYLHGELYSREYGYGIGFETYVAMGLCEFYRNYEPEKERAWICEHKGKIVGFLLLMHRGQGAQLRYFILAPGYRGKGLGNRLMQLFIHFMKATNYRTAFLWTTSELHTAAHLYKKHGFQLTQEKESDVFGKPVTEQRYDLVLDDSF